MSAAMGFFSKGLKNEFETVMVNEPSVFKPLTVYFMWSKLQIRERIWARVGGGSDENFKINFVLPVTQ